MESFTVSPHEEEKRKGCLFSFLLYKHKNKKEKEKRESSEKPTLAPKLRIREKYGEPNHPTKNLVFLLTFSEQPEEQASCLSA